MDHHEIIEVLDRHIFSLEKVYLVSNIAENPERFLGIFRSTTPRLKLVQNVLQSREIRFGDALEEIITGQLAEAGFINFPKMIRASEDTLLHLDQYFTNVEQNRFFLVEQKVRDDHDSSKKDGQIRNFRRKLTYLRDQHGTSLIGVMYFIDPSLSKNRPYYFKQLKELEDELGIELHLFYNGELFEFLTGNIDAWEVLKSALLTWRDSALRSELNFDCDKEDEATDELMSIKPLIWYKLVTNDHLWESRVLDNLFPTGATLKRISNLLATDGSKKFSLGKSHMTFSDLAHLVEKRINSHYKPR